MRDKIILRLGDNYLEKDAQLIESYIEEYTSIACSETNLKKDNDKLEPHIIQATIKAYMRRGNEGMNSSNESGFNVSYEDIEESLRKNVRPLRVLP